MQANEEEEPEIHELFETWESQVNVYFTLTRPTKTLRQARHRGEECRADRTGNCCMGRTCLCYQQRAECGGDCPCKCRALAHGICQNQQMRRAGSVQCYVVRDHSKRHNRFLVDQPVKSGQFIIEMTGIFMETERLKQSELPELGDYHVMHCYQHAQTNMTLDMRMFGNKSRYIRSVCQGCRPSARVVEVFVDCDLHLGVFARRDLRTGEEVTIPFDRDPSPEHIIRCPQLIPNACLFKARDSNDQRFTSHPYVEPRNLDIYRFLIKVMVMDPKAYNRLQRMWGLPRTKLRRQIAAARGDQENTATRKSTKRVRPPPDKGKERLSSLADVAAAAEEPHAEHAPHVDSTDGVGDDDDNYDETTGGWWQLTDAERDMLPMAFPEAEMVRLDLTDQPVVAPPPPRPVIHDPPTFLQDCQVLDQIWDWTRTNVEFVRDAAAWSAMVRKYAKDKSIPNLNINLNWARYNVKKDEKSILPRSFVSKSKLMTELTHLVHLTINPCECQFSATAFQNLTRFTNLRSLGVDGLDCVSDEVLEPFTALQNLVHLRVRQCPGVTLQGLQNFSSGLKSLDLGQGQIITQDNLPTLFRIFPGLVGLTLDSSPRVTDELAMRLPYARGSSSSSSFSSSAAPSYCPLISLSLQGCGELSQFGVNTICPEYFPFLTALSVGHCASLPAELALLTRLSRLDISGIINLPSDISHILARLEGLTYLGVANTGMLFDDLCTVGNTLRRLTEFDVTSCHAVKGHEGLLQLRLPPGCKLIF